MIKIQNFEIGIWRGDTYCQKIHVIDQDNNPVDLSQFQDIKLSFRNLWGHSVSAGDLIFSGNTLEINKTPDETEIQQRTYCWTLKFVNAEGRAKTWADGTFFPYSACQYGTIKNHEITVQIEL